MDKTKQENQNLKQEETLMQILIENKYINRLVKTITQEDDERLSQEHGMPLFISRSRGMTLNQRYFTGLFRVLYKVIYSSKERLFFLYNYEDGTWEPKDNEFMQELIANMLRSFAATWDDGYMEDILQKNTVAFQSNIMKALKGLALNSEAFSKRIQSIIHCANRMLIYDKQAGLWQSHDFAPEYFSRNRSPIRVEPNAGCPVFLEKLLRPAMTQDDIDLLQRYVGQSLLGDNSSQTFLLLTGTAGGGKSTLVNIVEGIIGRWNCTELRLEHMTGRFEISRTSGKTLLTAKDVCSEFLSSPGAKKLKALTGKDTMTLELKNSNKAADVLGNFNVIITSNSLLRPAFDGDADAWRRRILWIRYENPPVTEKIPHFDELLLETEGSGILNWALEGAAKLLQNEGKITRSPEQNARIEFLLQSADPVGVFVKQFIKADPDSTISTSEAVFFIKSFCEKMGWPNFSDRRIQVELKDAMLSVHEVNLRTDVKRNGKNVRGYYNVRFVVPPQIS